MGKNEIKLRRKVLNPLEVERYRDYSQLVKRHKRAKRQQRAIRFLTFSLLVTVIIMLLLIVISFLFFKV